jgi:FkbM family methyltransferase
MEENFKMIDHIEKKENWHEDFIVNLAAQLMPQIYVELGLYHCELFNAMIPYSETLIGVDVSAEAGKYMIQSEKVMFMNMTTDEFAELLKKHPVSIDLLFIDADHTKESVLKDFWNYFPFVKEQGLILLHDTYPKNSQYTDKGYCGNAYLVIDELKNHFDEFEFVTIPIHPGLTIIRKRKTQLAWENPNEIKTNYTSTYFEKDLNKSITMPSFVSKVKQLISDEKEIRTIVEIGSLDAQDSQYFKKIFPEARVIAIEALPENFEKYLKPMNNIETINAVVSHIDGEVTFYKKEINGIHSIYNRGDEYGNVELKLPSYRFETLANKYNINKVDMLKLDVEGATFEVLESMGSLLPTVKIMHIETESYPFFKGQKLHSEVVRFLEQKGFSLVELTSFPIQPGKLQYDSIWINENYFNEKLIPGP